MWQAHREVKGVSPGQQAVEASSGWLTSSSLGPRRRAPRFT
jgi:hypothetical protein